MALEATAEIRAAPMAAGTAEEEVGEGGVVAMADVAAITEAVAVAQAAGENGEGASPAAGVGVGAGAGVGVG